MSMKDMINKPINEAGANIIGKIFDVPPVATQDPETVRAKRPSFFDQVLQGMSHSILNQTQNSYSSQRSYAGQQYSANSTRQQTNAEERRQRQAEGWNSFGGSGSGRSFDTPSPTSPQPEPPRPESRRLPDISNIREPIKGTYSLDNSRN